MDAFFEFFWFFLILIDLFVRLCLCMERGWVTNFFHLFLLFIWPDVLKEWGWYRGSLSRVAKCKKSEVVVVEKRLSNILLMHNNANVWSFLLFFFFFFSLYLVFNKFVFVCNTKIVLVVMFKIWKWNYVTSLIFNNGEQYFFYFWTGNQIYAITAQLIICIITPIWLVDNTTSTACFYPHFVGFPSRAVIG